MEANEAAEAHSEAKYSRGHQRAIYEVLVLVLHAATMRVDVHVRKTPSASPARRRTKGQL